eukprot:scaffold9708_cov130-Skeletonema_marinoi.AAC.3
MEPTKQFSTSGKNRLRFVSAKERAKKATADVYRTSDRRHNVSSTAVREKRVHSAGGAGTKKKKKKRRKNKDSSKDDEEEEEEEDTIRYFGRDTDAGGLGIGRTAVIVSSKSKLVLDEQAPAEGDLMDEDNIGEPGLSDDEEKDKALLTGGTIFLAELEISSQRNGSQLFQNLVRQLRPLSNSLAELLHHKEKIVELLCAFLLSPREEDGAPTPRRRANEDTKSYKKWLAAKASNGFVANLATSDVLHLFGVLARELRREIYPFLNTTILPRIIDDLLNPPSVIVIDSEKHQNNTLLDVSLVESAFRTLSYLFKYNSDELISSQPPNLNKTDEKKTGDADIIRQYYGKTICHKRELVRRLACESYAPLLRKCTDKGLKRHLSRSVKALASSLALAAEQNTGFNSDHNMERARSDAIDGVSSLLFEVARSVAGRLYSKKGILVIRSLMDCLTGISKKSEENGENNVVDRNKVDAIYEVSSQLLSKLRDHVLRGGSDAVENSFTDVFNEIQRTLESQTALLNETSTSLANKPIALVTGRIVDLLAEVLEFQNGRLAGGHADQITQSLQSLLGDDIYQKVGQEVQSQILNFLCAAWKANPSHTAFASRLGKFFPSIVTGSLDQALFLAKNLLPYLPKRVASSSLVPALLNSTAISVDTAEQADSSLVLLHTISTTVWADSQADSGGADETVGSLFAWEAAEECPVMSTKTRKTLLDVCCIDLDKKSAEQLSRIGYASRCIPFLVYLECSSDGGDDASDEEEQSNTGNGLSEDAIVSVFQWYAKVMKAVQAMIGKGHENLQQDLFTVQSLLLESFSKSSIECHRRLPSSRVKQSVKKTMAKTKSYANTLLRQQPKSAWVVRGVAAIVKTLQIVEPGSKLNDHSNDTFELLAPNLAQPNHSLRLLTLEILEHYPARPFITDHADLDLTDDLDEEQSQRPQAEEEDTDQTSDNQPGSSLSGACDVVSMLKHLELTPVTFDNERNLTSQLGRVEVYARTGKLPIVYAEVVAYHMLGLLHVKFAPVWPAAVKVIVSLSVAQEGPVWPCIEAALKRSMMKTIRENCDEVASADSIEPSSAIETITSHHSLCLLWDSSKGKNISLFGNQNMEKLGEVPRHDVVDGLTLFESVWSIMENGPHLTATKSKVVVPLFFEFMVSQYYVFHDDDQDLREIKFPELAPSTEWNRKELGHKSIHRKLESFLKMFAAVKGPQQLVSHQTLLQLFVAFLSNQDTRMANLAFACVSRFKLPYLVPYVEYIRPMLKKEGLRDALTKFNLSVDSETVISEHRLPLMPIVTRILFGRLAARGNGSKSSKDSPAARRAAILSFFSGVGNTAGELNYFLYMMVRAFIPQHESMTMNGVENQNDHLKVLIELSGDITTEGLMSIPLKRQEGFLKLLSDVITQVGFGVKGFVGTFISLLLTLCEQSENALVKNTKNQEMKNMIANDNENQTESLEDTSQNGSIRTLSFLRLTDIFNKFASTVDFLMYSERLWKSMHSSIVALPNTVVNAENTPSLMRLLECIASHSSMIPLLAQCDDAIIAVFKCIAGTTRMKVMNNVLRFIDSLLTDGDSGNTLNQNTEDGLGRSLVLKHIHLLIAQFTNRLQTDSKIANLDGEVSSGKGFKQPPLAGLQLNILCRVTELLVSVEKAEEENVTTMESLCGLLVPLLKFDSNPNQLYLVRTIHSLIPKMSNEGAMAHFHSLSKLLGPNKANAGISSNEHRQLIASVLKAISDQDVKSSSLVKVAKAVVEANAVSTKYVNEHDYERILPALNSLGTESGDESWFGLSKETAGSIAGPRVLLPLLYTCFHLLYDADGVVSRVSNKALKCVVTTCIERAKDEDLDELSRNSWIKFIETTFIPSLKIGIMTKDASIRRSFVLLFSHVARHFGDYDSVHLYGDLKSLIRDDDQDLDFFLNVTHVQLHRRARAFNRLRKTLTSSDEPLFSEQSYVNVLLPLAMHPIYEYSSKTEEAYVLEAIAAAGEICRHLPWSKYNNTLQTALNNLGRYPDQERFLIAMMCSIIDAFHFPVETGESADSATKTQGNGVWRSLKNRIIPKVESFLIKEKTDKSGATVKSLRPSVTLALMKLFQKFPLKIFEEKLPKLITVVCGALRNKESNERDIARETLSKMAVSLDLKYLPLILSELSVALYEGYKLHVRSAALHSILVALSKVYQQPAVQSDDDIASLPFERCVPAMLDIIHQDIFGKASEIKEVQHVQKRLIKEAMGSKSQDSLEIIARNILFKPSVIAVSVKETLPGLSHASAVHALITPLLERLRDPEVSPSTIRKVKECLQRITVGLSNNSTANYDELLPFVYATVSPFVYGRMNPNTDEDNLDDSDGEEDAPIQVSKSGVREASKSKPEDSTTGPSSVAVATWNPSSLGAAESKRAALIAKKKAKHDLHKVIDGVSAPKFTGSSRNSSLQSSSSKTLNMPANACAVNFGLALLNSCLKRSKIDVTNELHCSMADPFLPLLAHCMRYSSDNQAVVLSFKSLGFLLRMDLPSVPQTAKELGPGILDHLSSSGAASNAQNEIVQGCFKSLTLLISHPKFASVMEQDDATYSIGDTTEQFVHNETLPLTADQMQGLLSLLHGAVRESEQHNATFGLVKAIAAKRYMSPEFFDLMDIVLKLSVQSQKQAVRLQCSQIFLNYLVDYPMGSKRLDNHLQQIVLNMKYEYEEGRLSAIELLSSLIQKFPLPVLEEHAQLFFLPLVLSLVNDESKTCKEAVADCISLILKRLSTDTVQSLYGYVKRWSEPSGTESIPMQLASAQLFGIFVEARPDYVKRGRNSTDLADLIMEVISQHSSSTDDNGWELVYHYLVCMEKLNKYVPGAFGTNLDVWSSLVSLMAYPHPWIMQVSSRIVSGHLSAIDYKELARNGSDSLLAKVPGSLYDIARNSCRQLDVEDRLHVDATCTIAIKNITTAFKIMKLRPDLCYEPEATNENENEELNPKGKSKDPCLWLMARLSNIAKPRGKLRRESVFKCFAALCTSCSPADLVRYLQLMIDPIDRDVRDKAGKARRGDFEDNDPRDALPNEVLQILEDTCGTDNYVKAYAKVSKNARQKKDKRKQDIASEAIHDPVASAQRKVSRGKHEQERKKRRMDENRSSRGGGRFKKNRNY